PHDANEPVGYAITTDMHKIAITTDLGRITPEVTEHFANSDIIVIESNHDIYMLENGPYPEHLKQRIKSDFGHLSNVACGVFLSDACAPNTKHIFLAHLSEDNNRPSVAFDTVKNILLSKKIDVETSIKLHIADRHRPSPLIQLV
ncbi:MAG: MBL fold metallo-hydrolase, partial [Defluviitaleaceae bacterium]|nr:MBL fold metallo-hydrolase [Defluviitaleaceae bacterium]